ncbi:PREDICTED: uncharacterized protein LOC109590991 isoform X2 [Amphimedon queenslandica]|uniref:Uncharacterized protein n=1 Tax=Amphimedon queenslandica TaxID=400682 RepID=A0AAN0JYS1_AMPQE|nr:PREDICTED: uncharacterized protein LOC109590991 isoform X2 [Amphimedon queenslandica]|eukprot:XP_019862372.1 PREDICTED: uncharacterized protein LOC109590991 isoform X2 [Amphimedon queenslandica]
MSKRSREDKRDKERHRQHKSNKEKQAKVDNDEYKNMTPAERLKAKVKVLLDKTTPSGATPPPNPVQVLELETENEFKPQSFTSKRKDKNIQEDKVSEGTSIGRHDDAMFGATKRDDEGMEIISHVPSLITKTIELPVLSDAEVSRLSEERALKWKEKLKLLREKYIHN